MTNAYNPKNTVRGHICTPPENFALRLFLMAAGIIMSSLATAALLKLNLGTDPYSSFIRGLSGKIGVSYGTTQLSAQLFIFIFMLARGRRLIGVGMLSNMIFSGYIVDLGTFILDRTVTNAEVWDSLIVKAVVLIPALAVFIVGAALYMAVDLGVSPYDGMPYIITDLLKSQKISFRRVRTMWDFLFMTMGFALGGSFGIVTVIEMLFLGRTISYFGKKVEPLLHAAKQA
ncbi:MAG: hypothetical protein LUD44_02395 [Firmicutes bacterium]|nr:hypothetical protein [Bacillota bacterium]